MKAYFNTHTDITLPYEEIEYVKIVKKDNSEVDLIRNGRCSIWNRNIKQVL